MWKTLRESARVGLTTVQRVCTPQSGAVAVKTTVCVVGWWTVVDDIILTSN